MGYAVTLMFGTMQSRKSYRNKRLSKEEWLDNYLYIEIHEIFFVPFPTELYEWIPELVQRLEASDDKIKCVVDHWLDLIIKGFITEFVVNTSVSYSEAEQCFLKGP